MQVDVIAVFNTYKEVKPLWLVMDKKKIKIDKINSVYKSNGMVLFNITAANIIMVLGYDGVHWNVDLVDPSYIDSL